MGQVSTALSIPVTFDHLDKTYSLSAWNYKIQGQYERYLEDRAVQACRRMMRSLSPDEAEQALASVQRDIACGIYSFGSDQVAKSLKSLENLKHLFYLQLHDNHSEVKPKLVEELFETRSEEMLELMSRANGISDGSEEATAKPDPTPAAEA